MKKFTKSKTIEELQIHVDERGLWMDTEGYDTGDDFIRIGWYEPTTVGFGFIAFYPWNGKFFVYDENKNSLATHESKELDGTPWYDEILNFLYIKNPLESEVLK